MSTLRHPLRTVALPASLVVSALAVVAVVVGLVSPTAAPWTASTLLPQETESEVPTPAETETASVESIEARITSYEVFLARDPFEPVIPEADGADGGTTGGTTGDGTQTVAPTIAPTVNPTIAPTVAPTVNPTTSPTSSPSPSPSPSGTASPSPGDQGGGCVSDGAVRCDGQTVSLVDVYDDSGSARAVVRVNETVYEVSDGETFATHYRVLSIEAPCVTLQYGDDRFSLCEGESVLK